MTTGTFTINPHGDNMSILYDEINADIDEIIKRLETAKGKINGQSKIDEVVKAIEGTQNMVNYWNYKLEKLRNGV